MEPIIQRTNMPAPQSPPANRRFSAPTTRAPPKSRQTQKSTRHGNRAPVDLPNRTVIINRVETDPLPSAPLANILPMRNHHPLVPITKPKPKTKKKSRKSTPVTVYHKGKARTITRHTLQRYNWGLKDRFDQTNFSPEEVVAPRKVIWPSQTNFYPLRDADTSRDLSGSAFLNPLDFFDNRDNFNAICKREGMIVKPRTQPKKPKKKRV